jgi:hypothetical protein
VILRFRDDWLREFFVDDGRSKKIPSDPGNRNDRRNVPAATALILARVFGNQPGFLAECAAAKRFVGGDAFTARSQTDRARATSDISGMRLADAGAVACALSLLGVALTDGLKRRNISRRWVHSM